MEKIKFTVDAALLRELGERLVGQPHIALAELVKNSYDADATKVEIEFAPDRIVVRDNGHGMDFEEFEHFWMRIGSPHKREQRHSRGLQRPLTGSKGVGRLAVQFLARELEMHTVSDRDPGQEIDAMVDWDTAVEAGDLTEAVALYEIGRATSDFPGDGRHGTIIELTRLNREWEPDDFKKLAQEIWWLQPPFQGRGKRSKEQADFEVTFSSEDQEAVDKFQTQMQAFMNIWHARVTGSLHDVEGNYLTRELRLTLEFEDGSRSRWIERFDNCPLDELDFEIRTYYFQYRQPFGIKVGEARDYFNQHGGVYVYDAGFRLPYYGPDHDWLNLEFAHAHRLSKSKLLPEKLQVPEGLTYLPTKSRLLGIVNVNTSHERAVAKSWSGEYADQHLDIQVTRDRLVDNAAYQKLQEIIRWPLDYYAMEEAKRRLRKAEAKAPQEPATHKFRRVGEVLAHYKEAIPKPAFTKLEQEVEEAVQASETEAEIVASKVELLAPLATAGMAAIALEHETKKQLARLSAVAEELERLEVSVPDAESRRLGSIAAELRTWVVRARELRAIFDPLMNEENRETRASFKAQEILRDVRSQIRSLTRHASIEIDQVDLALRLPIGGYTQWSALFQNVLLNAVNATLEAEEKRIVARSRDAEKGWEILIEDTGTGVSPEESERLFEPFVRKTRLSPERRELGLGGSGLGLTIVRMLADELGCDVGFVEAPEGFNTAFRLAWEEGE